MNHIQMYEKVINDPDIDYELKGLMKQFYLMNLEKANEAIEKVKQMIDSKTTYFMNN